MVKLNVLKKYFDIKLGRSVAVGEILEVSKERALELLSHKSNLVEVLEISKLSSKKNEAVASARKKRKAHN
mgnify:FL=1